MFAAKREAGLAMVYRLSTGLPVDELEVHSVMVGVALGTILTGYSRSDPNRMHTTMLNETIADFRMAIQAFQLHSSRAQVVTFCAVQNAIERLVRFGQRPRGDLRAGLSSAQDKNQKRKDPNEDAGRQSAGPIRFV